MIFAITQLCLTLSSKILKVAEVDEEDVDEEESVEEELEDDTDEFDTASPDAGSVDGEVMKDRDQIFEKFTIKCVTCYCQNSFN